MEGGPGRQRGTSHAGDDLWEEGKQADPRWGQPSVRTEGLKAEGA
jgi:hypothetical protein